jgi:hypothetical protein
VLSPAGVITGRVVDDRGQPLEAFTVVADTGGDFGADGARRLVGVEQRRRELPSLERARGKVRARGVRSPRLSATVPDVAVWKARRSTSGTVKLRPAGVVRGTAVDPSGGPVSGASIYASMRPQAGRARVGPAR